ncbi:MAG TPA: excinuclease ABC subunit UvrC [Rhodocyclaceae bacterium]|nr:excinuclease ABC subunit UvrC [Rhodocyclaceae bacterium]HMV53992.1 excinuclease ABC subunit UvrC [Rhodocyclaceae bacterium]HNB79050.1 excinuclease ABC subunit UvrC [Rhodocyclaceae bacterium]HNH13846.1 excinuclease ABC subunit UvrC [Rhodocyclaceae bacterium]HNH99655.1 excinuclease ABC subunit UvrC [Rhodocyclaceae bacterium]
MFDSKAFLANCPEHPGVYRMIGAEDEVLYVGKAKNLRKRVSSYFRRTLSSPRIGMMVQQVVRVDITVTRSESEALLLENNLIKELAPKYNILFRDDKSYPWIVLTNDGYPRIGFHRGSFAKGARYFGPFPSASAVRESVQLLQKIFLLRTCENTVFANRSRPCLLHQIKRCSGPCVGLIGEDAYAADVRLASMFLDGKHSEVISRLTEKMERAAGVLAFEHAAAYRDQIRTLQKVLSRQYVESAKEEDVDILAAVSQGGLICVNLAMVRGGRHLGDRPQFAANAVGVSAEDALLAFVDQHYREHAAPLRILVNVEIGTDLQDALDDAVGHRVALTRPRLATERAWMDMAVQNAELAVAARVKDRSRSEERLEALQHALGLIDVPSRIECFDISHTMGEATVASCVVFADKGMKKSEYRRYNIHDVTAGDDYAAMRQVLTRRYEKVAAGEGTCPDLVLIDGGKGQVGVAREVLVEVGLEHVPMIGVAKGEERKPGLEDLIFPDGRAPIHLKPDDPALHLIQEIRDEAHRFAIGGHRARRAKTRATSRLEDIPGIGPTRRKRLLAEFGGMQGVKAATIEDLCRVDGISVALAEQIHRLLH